MIIIERSDNNNDNDGHDYGDDNSYSNNDGHDYSDDDSYSNNDNHGRAK